MCTNLRVDVECEVKLGGLCFSYSKLCPRRIPFTQISEEQECLIYIQVAVSQTLLSGLVKPVIQT